MKKSILALLPLFWLTAASAQQNVTVLVKQHDDRIANFAERPYGKDDISYGLYLDWFEGLGGWRLGASYASSLSGPGEADSVITPEITLLGSDGMWETGISILMDYVDAEDKTEWGDLYYQIQLGVNLPLSKRLQIGAHAFYPFSSFSDFTDIRTGDLEYGLLVRFRF